MTLRRTNPKRRLFIVDDHPMMRHGLAQFLGQEDDLAVCGEASTKAETLEKIRDARADLAIVDLALPDQGGLELIKDLRIQFPDLPILVHSMHDGTIFAERAIRAGARGYVMKQESGRELISALRQVLAGKIYLGTFSAPRPSPKTHSKPALDTGGPISLLSDREFEIMQHIGSGLSNREIALRLRLSIKTVDAHRERIKRKLGLKSTTALNLFAVRWVNSLTTA